MTIKKLEKITDNLEVKQLPPVTHYLSTGCTILDLAIADRLPGGFGAGRINHIWGTESSSKSMLVAEVMRSAQSLGGFACLVDSETTFDLVRAETLHDIDTKNLIYTMPDKDELTIEYLFDTIIKEKLKDAGKKRKAPDLLSIDSLSAIPSKVEIGEDMADKTFGVTRAKSLSTGFRKYIWELEKANLTLLFVDQTRQKIGVLFGEKDTISGGKALSFYASTRVKTTVESKIKNKYDKIIGINVKFRVDKNKVAPPFREGVFRILFDYGIDDTGTNIEFLKENQEEKGWYNICGKKLRSLEDAIKYVEGENLENVLIQEVYKSWKEIYAVVERKRRIRRRGGRKHETV